MYQKLKILGFLGPQFTFPDMVRQKGKQSNRKAVEKAIPRVAKVSPLKGNKARKRNYLVEDSASESGAGEDPESSDSDSGDSETSFIDDSQQEVEASSTQELYMQQNVRSCGGETRDGRAHYANTEKYVGHDSFPVNEFSVTVSKIKGDVHQAAIGQVHSFIKELCIKGDVYVM